LGFFGVVVYTLVQTPRFWGEPFRAGVFFFFATRCLPFLTSWLIVGIYASLMVWLGPPFSARTGEGLKRKLL